MYHTCKGTLRFDFQASRGYIKNLVLKNKLLKHLQPCIGNLKLGITMKSKIHYKTSATLENCTTFKALEPEKSPTNWTMFMIG
jgi:hypothetical protein